MGRIASPKRCEGRERTGETAIIGLLAVSLLDVVRAEIAALLCLSFAIVFLRLC